LNQYSVFTHLYLDPVAVKHGFNWPSFFFGPVWALYIGCWRGFAIYAITITAHVGSFWIGYFLALDEGPRMMAFFLYLSFMLALEIWLSTIMNAWHTKSLLNKGYVEADVVTALDRPHALSKSSQRRPVTTLVSPNE